MKNIEEGQSAVVRFADHTVPGEIVWVDDWGLALRQWNDAVLFIPWAGTIAYVEAEAKELDAHDDKKKLDTVSKIV